MTNSKAESGEWTNRVHQQTVKLAAWTAAWLLTMALARFGADFFWNSHALTITMVIINISVGIGMVVANIRQVNMLDEMMQKIQLQAMALALGAGVVGGLSYALLDVTNIMRPDAKIGFLVIAIAITYLGTLLANYWKYR